MSEHAADARLAPVEYLRQLPPDTAVLLYGRAPALRLTTTPWYTDPALRRLVDPDAAARSDGSCGVAAWGDASSAAGDEPGRPQATARPQIQPAALCARR